jgi:hypothetical protein
MKKQPIPLPDDLSILGTTEILLSRNDAYKFMNNKKQERIALSIPF